LPPAAARRTRAALTRTPRRGGRRGDRHAQRGGVVGRARALAFDGLDPERAADGEGLVAKEPAGMAAFAGWRGPALGVLAVARRLFEDIEFLGAISSASDSPPCTVTVDLLPLEGLRARDADVVLEHQRRQGACVDARDLARVSSKSNSMARRTLA
jgi:hypothetical protein